MSVQENKPEGVLLVDKPQGITSHDVVDRVRRIYQLKQVGHAGTLDPMATGLMIVLVGRATKISQFLMSLDKVYTGTITLGVETDSYDADGEVLDTKPVPELREESLMMSMAAFVGDQYQEPPMFSAKKIKGVPLYKMARKGKTVEREPRFIRVSKFEMKRFETPDIDFELACSKGTYVRSVAHDLGAKLECGAHLSALRRTKIDRFLISESHDLESLKEMSNADKRSVLIPVNKAVPSHVMS
ncbi:MAG: tRNA pseudouridine(55) synthase TruB [Opitutales bacterium]|nr:tRNA pseudouridine(55) synthase TruB [Opitutales bacterium]NRA25826.1 tRNA pseudouridine(55) synthase TruB [Opitutales bacterium]